jgi:hypothetical protein
MTILDLERQVISLREQLAKEKQSNNAEIRRIAAELGFPLGGVTIEQIIGRIREIRTKLRVCKFCGRDISVCDAAPCAESGRKATP